MKHKINSKKNQVINTLTYIQVMKRIIPYSAMLFLLFSCIDDGIESEHDIFLPLTPVDSLPNTDFVSTLNEKLKPDQNQIYCSALLFAWLEIKNELKSNIKTDSKSIKRLNDADNYENSLLSTEISTSISVEEDIIKASAYLRKSLPFTLEFLRNNHDLKFKDNDVESFGLSGCDNFDIKKQIEIVHYKNDNEFILKLLPKDSIHEIFIYLPKKNNFKNLEDITKSIENKIDKREKVKTTDRNYWKYNFLEDDRFSMPVISYNIEKYYSNIIGQSLSANNKDFLINDCYQTISFILDEAGAEIESKVTFSVVEEIEEELPQPKNLFLDRPFFIMLKRTDSNNPYLAMWVENRELMIQK